ncbi:MAG: tetratricopeptide repeat protein [Thermoplasmata archaeon]
MARSKKMSEDAKALWLLGVCQRRLKEDPKDVDALFCKGVALAKMGKYKESIIHLNKVTLLSPKYPGIDLFKARVYEALELKVSSILD